MKRVLVPLSVLLVLVVVLVPTPALGAASAKASISGVTVSPTQPAPGEQVTFSVTIRNGESTPSSPSNAFEVNQVSVRTESGDMLTKISDPGTVSEGESLTLPLTASFAKEGIHNLRVVVFGYNGVQNVVLRYPIALRVREGGPQLSVETWDDPVVGVEGNTTVSVVNGDAMTASGLRLSLTGQGVDVADPVRALASLSPGASHDATFEVTPLQTRATMVAVLEYRTESGAQRTITERVQLRPEPLREDVHLDATVKTAGSDPPVTVDLSNFGNAPLEDVVVRARDGGSVVASRAIADVPVQTTRTVSLNVTDVERANLTVVASYETGERIGEVATSVAYRSNPGRVELTGIDMEREGDRIHLAGSASNVGLGDVNGVVVSVVPTAGVTPTRPYREYFVGTVPASDFVTFDLYAQVSPNATEIPIRVTYLVDGERRSDIQTVSTADVPPPETETPSGPSPLTLVAAILLLLVAVGAYYAHRRRRRRNQ